MSSATPERARHGAGRGTVGAALAVAVSLLAAGCSQAGDGKSSLASPVRGAAELTGFATTVPEPAEFVTKSRQGEPQFMAVGVTPPARGVKARSPDEVKSLEAELDATLRQHNAVSGRKPTGDVYKSAAAQAKPQPAPRGSDRFLIQPRPQPQDPRKTVPKPKPAAGGE